jgi:hypothetical protein
MVVAVKPEDLRKKEMLALLLGPRCEALEHLLGDIQASMKDDQSLVGLSLIEADLMMTVTIHGVVGNGGFAYWYAGADVARTRRIVAAFERMGATDVADVVRSTLEGLPETGLKKHIGDDYKAFEKRFEVQSREMSNHKRGWDELAVRYVLANEKAVSTSRKRRTWIDAMRSWLEEIHPS